MSAVEHRDVIVVGAGAAGLAAAAALAGAGKRVMVLERKPYVGGRAYSYQHPALGEVVDSQHVLLGCCTNLIELCEQAGTADKVRWYDEQTFLEPNGQVSRIRTSALPAPLHFAPSFVAMPMLGWKDKAGIARGLMEFFRSYPAEDSESVERWLKRTGQTELSIRHFWKPIVLATLNDGVAECSTKYAGKVFHELFVKSSVGGRLGVPTVPLSEFYEGAARLVESLGGAVRLRASVDSVVQQADGRWLVGTADAGAVPGVEYMADAVILALPFEQTQKLLGGLRLRAPGDGLQELESKLGRMVHSPFTSVLLWYDRQISDLDHAWLLDSTIEWFFHKSRIRRYALERGSYVEVVIAASKAQLAMGREEILSSAIRELGLFFPESRGAKLLKSGVLKEARATFSVLPGLDRFRPSQATEWPGLFLAGDWTVTEWPSTMEGGVRSGRLAAGEAVGERNRFVAAETPASGLMRWISRR
ncbi:MAG: hydroxysqualene dehydroxylase HpnE [Acidobacteriota bacterium]|nr:hydroxysqualene dehydroxylase HpnE [Acidobacteriota bacterium]